MRSTTLFVAAIALIASPLFAQDVKPYAPAVEPCEAVQTYESIAPCEAVQAVAPCEPIQAVAPCEAVRETISPCEAVSFGEKAGYIRVREFTPVRCVVQKTIAIPASIVRVVSCPRVYRVETRVVEKRQITRYRIETGRRVDCGCLDCE